MILTAAKKDLVVLASCSQTRFAIEGVLSRPERLRIRHISADFLVHPNHDPGCLRESEEFLRSQLNRYDKALVIFDRDGCGQERKAAHELQEMVESRLRVGGWNSRAAAVVIDPELEAWVWSDSPEVDRVLGWSERVPQLRVWLSEKGLLSPDQSKPSDPKRAVDDALRAVKKQRSAAIYLELAQCVSFRRCVDPSFKRLCDLLQMWFGAR